MGHSENAMFEFCSHLPRQEKFHQTRRALRRSISLVEPIGPRLADVTTSPNNWLTSAVLFFLSSSVQQLCFGTIVAAVKSFYRVCDGHHLIRCMLATLLQELRFIVLRLQSRIRSR